MPDHLQTARTISRDIYRTMSWDAKYRQLLALRQLAWELKAAWVRERFPQFSDQAVEDKVREIFINART